MNEETQLMFSMQTLQFIYEAMNAKISIIARYADRNGNAYKTMPPVFMQTKCEYFSFTRRKWLLSANIRQMSLSILKCIRGFNGIRSQL